MAIKDMFNASKIKEENEVLKKTIEEIGGNDLIYVRNQIQQAKSDLDNVIEQKNEMQKRIQGIENEMITKRSQLGVLDNYILLESQNRALENEIKIKKSQLLSLDDQLSLESFALYTPKYEMVNSNDYKNKLDEIREAQKTMIKHNLAVTGNMNWTVNNNAKEGKKMVNDMIKLVLRSFNNECDTSIASVKFNNIDTVEKKINTVYDTLNKLATLMQVAISPNYKNLKIQELYLAYEYQLKKQEEKEQLKAMKEQMREDARVEKELEEARQTVYKEQNHYNNAINKIQKQLESCKSEDEKKLLETKIDEYNSKLSDIGKQLENIDYRESNRRAGYVYVISNIGAFGENVYKIGMTRRLEPLERVYELGDASVPFEFDVHAMIFSDDAPKLENALHKAFEDKKVNMINARREFFRVSLDEVEKVVKQNHDKLVEFIKYPEAKEFRESFSITGKKFVTYQDVEVLPKTEIKEKSKENVKPKSIDTGREEFIKQNKETIERYIASINDGFKKIGAGKTEEEEYHQWKLTIKFIKKFKEFCDKNNGQSYYEETWKSVIGNHKYNSIDDLEKLIDDKFSVS